MPWTKDYRDFQREQDDDDGPNLDEHYEYQQDLDLGCLDTCVGDDHWHQKYMATGSIDIDPDWM